jgi:hypothetical protein
VEQRPDTDAPHGQTESGLAPEHEPVTTGTLFILLLFLMATAGLWAIMYLTLLDR